MATTVKTIALVLFLAGISAGAQAGSVTQKGSDTMVILAQKWAETYMAETPGTKVQVTGGGSGTGFAALQNRVTDLANASRKIKAKEIEACIKAFGKRPTEYKVALDALSVYVHESNPVRELSIPQLEGVFTGKIRNWKELGGPDLAITVYSRENSSGTYEFFKEHVLGGKDFVASAQTMPGTAAVLQQVAKDKTAIGYGGIAYGAGARSVLVKKDAKSPGVEPTEKNVMDGTYPIWRFLFIYVNPALDKGEVAHYLKWIRSEKGQGVVKDVGYFPLPAKWRAS